MGFRSVGVMETATRAIPEGLAQMAPGLGLAVLLAGIDFASVADGEVVDVLVARDRQGAHDRARFLGAVLETAQRSSAVWGSAPGQVSRYAADEVRAALMLTPWGADGLVDFAWEIFVRLPRLGEGMLAGELDERRAQKFTFMIGAVPDELARRVCEKLVPRASRWTTSQLGAKIRRELMALDPEWARKRYEAAIEERDVSAYLDPEGTVTVTGRHLPVGRDAAASDRIDRLAKSAKTAGDRRRIGHLRADLYIGMLDGTYSGLTDAQILAHLLANPPDPDDDDLDDPGPDEPDDPVPATAPSLAASSRRRPPGRARNAGWARNAGRARGLLLPRFAVGSSCRSASRPCWARKSSRPSSPGGARCTPRSPGRSPPVWPARSGGGR